MISTKVGAIPELVEDGQTGLLIRWNDPVALAEAIGTLLGDPAEAARMGLAGRAKALKSFSLDKIIERNLNSYQQALA